MILSKIHIKKIKRLIDIFLLKNDIEITIKNLYKNGTSKKIYNFLKKHSDVITEDDKNKLKILTGDVVVYKNDLNYYSNPTNHLGNLKYIYGSLCLEKTLIKKFNNLLYVSCDLDLRNSQIASLGSLKYVGNDLDLRNSLILNLENLEYVGKSLLLQNTMLKNLGKLKYIQRNLYLNNKIKIEHLPEDLIIKGNIIEY